MNKFRFKDRDLVYKAKNLRERNLVPGVMFGPTIKTMPIMVKKPDLIRALNKVGEVYQVPTKEGTIFVKMGEIQREPISGEIIHFSLVQMPRGELSSIDVPICLTGTPEGIKEGGNLVVLRPTITLKGKPKDIPQEIKGSIDKLQLGESLCVKDLNLPTDVEVIEDLEDVVVQCQAPVMNTEESAL